MRTILTFLLSMSIAVTNVAIGEESGQRISLPRAELTGPVSLERALEERRSVRDFRRAPLVLADLAQLVWAAQGITDREDLRTAPSAGALYPIELYVVAGDVEGLSPGVYRYRPHRHELVLVAGGERRKPLASAALGQSYVQRAPAVLVLAAVYERSAGKYGQRAQRYSHIEIGHIAQNIYLQAGARGLGTVIVGAFDDSEVQDVLGLPSDHEPLALMPVGHPR